RQFAVLEPRKAPACRRFHGSLCPTHSDGVGCEDVMSGSIKRSLALLCALLTIAPQCIAGDHDWTVVTLTRNGMWGVASDSSQSQAMSEAIRLCRATAGPSAG